MLQPFSHRALRKATENIRIRAMLSGSYASDLKASERPIFCLTTSPIKRFDGPSHGNATTSHHSKFRSACTVIVLPPR
eukprot:2227689-Rhodomonas_salina.1